MNALRREVHLLAAALSFFTRLPVPGAAAITGQDLHPAARYFPVVGLVIGGLGAVVWWLASRVLPNDLAIVLSMIATVLATGAFHEDGFTDACDGFGGGYDGARVLAIMNDSRVGAFGVIGIVLLLALKGLALCHLPPALVAGALVSAHACSRWAAVTIMVTHDYVRDEPTAKARPMSARLRPGPLVVATVFGCLPVLALLPARCAWSLVAVLGVRWLLGRWFRQRIGGYTGDCLGATQQVCEVVMYLTIVAVL